LAARRKTRASRVPTPKAGRDRRNARAPRQDPGAPVWLVRSGLILTAVAFVCGFLLSIWIVRLDRIVVERFEGRRFEVPSVVLSAPTILYPGMDWKAQGLRDTLSRLGYREQRSPGALERGSYRWDSRRLQIHLRAFEHPSRSEPARVVEIALRGSLLGEINEAPDGRELGAVLVEPERVGAYYGREREQRDLVSLSDLPPHLIAAILATEDRRFESHHGIDFRRIVGAMLANLRAGAIRQGGSTLTQQLVKNFFLTPERTLSRKLQEAAMALLVEYRYEKAAILESYLNEIYLGQRGATEVHGVGEAARLYFGKRASDLTPAEAALIAAIIQSPNRTSPYRHPERATERRNLVLHLMEDQGYLTPEQAETARAQPLRLSKVTPDTGHTRYFLDLLRRQLPELYDAEVLSVEGLEIHSTLDPRLQRAAATALREGLAEVEERISKTPAGKGPGKLQGCIVALRPQTGEILAMVGGRDYRGSQFNRCVDARRPAGSVFKPFVYIAALEPGWGGPTITLASFLEDSPFEVETPSGPWRPENYDHEFRGRVPVREALERSLNVPAARLGQEVGIDRVADVARRLGITSPLPRVPSLVLGTADVSPLEVARAYATLANGGVRPWPHTFEDVVDPRGDKVERRSLQFDRVLDPGTSYLATSLLEGVVERGTAARVRALGFRGPIAGKTGTSDDERDLWFVGFTPEIVAVVWVGFDEPRSVGLVSSSVALPIWARFMREAVGTQIRGRFARPAEVQSIEIEPVSGALALAGCPVRRTEFFLEGTEPEQTCPEDPVLEPRRRGKRGLMRWVKDLL
jgi:penicillin-binding protein 1B